MTSIGGANKRWFVLALFVFFEAGGGYRAWSAVHSWLTDA
jgi:hypothetical protein